MGNDIFHLDNGLQVILREMHTAPVISFWVAYRVGSRNEQPPQTGISHWVEHMMFKGTERFPAGVLDREIDRAGGMWNAFTSMDTTMYYATLPRQQIELALAAESDRMVNALFDPAETESERSVIISERQGSENTPLFWLEEAMQAVAFRQHGYGHSIIGSMDDLHTMTCDDLQAHYRQYYGPHNATVVCVGAFDAAQMRARIEHHFGSIAAQASPPSGIIATEPTTGATQRVTVNRPGTTDYVSIAHHVPSALHDDWYALHVLDGVLSGVGNGFDGRTTRLYGALVKSGIAAMIEGGLLETIDPYLYQVTITLNHDRNHAEAEHTLLAEIERLQSQVITETELHRAKKQARASFAYSAESVTNQAYGLAQSAMLGDVTWYDHFLARVERVTADDVQRVARQYLTEAGRITGWLYAGEADDADTDEEGHAA